MQIMSKQRIKKFVKRLNIKLIEESKELILDAATSTSNEKH